MFAFVVRGSSRPETITITDTLDEDDNYNLSDSGDE